MSWRQVPPEKKNGARVLIAAATAGAIGLLLQTLPAAAAAPGAATPGAAVPGAAAPGAAAPPAASAVVARVNGSPILRRDFEMAVQMQFRQRGTGQRTHEDLQAVRSAVLDRLIDNELLYQKALQAKVSVSEQDVTEELTKLKTSLGTQEDVAAFLKANGVSEKDLTAQVRRSLMVRRYVDTNVASGISVTDQQTRAYYDAHPDQFKRPEAVRISQIVARVAPDATASARAEAREKIEAILKELRKGGDFAQLAKLHSDAPEGKKGGDSGWVWAGGGALPPVERAALQLQPGQMSDIVESRRGFHIIKATERRPAGVVPFDEARDRIAESLKSDAREAKVSASLADLRASARIDKSL